MQHHPRVCFYVYVVDTFKTVDEACCEATRRRIRQPGVKPVSVIRIKSSPTRAHSWLPLLSAQYWGFDLNISIERYVSCLQWRHQSKPSSVSFDVIRDFPVRRVLYPIVLCASVLFTSESNDHLLQYCSKPYKSSDEIGFWISFYKRLDSCKLWYSLSEVLEPSLKLF